MNDVIVFKGVRNGLELYIDGNQPFPVIVEQLWEKLKASSAFFNAGLEVTIICKDRDLTSEEIASLSLMLQKNELSLKEVLREGVKRNRPVMRRPKETSEVEKEIHDPESNKEEEIHSLVDEEEAEHTSKMTSSDQSEEDLKLFTPSKEMKEKEETPEEAESPVISEEPEQVQLSPEEIVAKKEVLTIQRTVRNGQLINHPGTVVVLGDVNPGSEIIAGGDVIIYGSCRGIVQAGVPDYQEATITATKLMATQIRIAHIVARSPDNREVPEHAERAMIQDGKILIEKI